MEEVKEKQIVKKEKKILFKILFLVVVLFFMYFLLKYKLAKIIMEKILLSAGVYKEEDRIKSFFEKFNDKILIIKEFIIFLTIFIILIIFLKIKKKDFRKEKEKNIKFQKYCSLETIIEKDETEEDKDKEN